MKLGYALLAGALLGAAPADASELVINGDFEAGVASFTSDYVYAPAGNSTEGEFDVRTNPSLWNSNFLAVGDHTSGSGNMLVANGSPSLGDIVWQSSPIAIAAGADYYFEAFVMNVCCNAGYTDINSDPLLTFSVSLDGGALQDLATLGIPANQSGNWFGLSSIFNSGSATTASLYLINANTIRGGNDFAVDDIHLGTTSIVNPGAAPEPATWALMIVGFGLIGGALRRRRQDVRVRYA